jgi:hypothetical protein
MTLPLSLTPGLRPALVLKCAAAGLFDNDTVTVSQPKSALALGGSIRGYLATRPKAGRARGTAPGRSLTRRPPP